MRVQRYDIDILAYGETELEFDERTHIAAPCV